MLYVRGKQSSPRLKGNKKMAANEIKKLYTKTKKALEKRTGDRFTWVMNTRQQQLGTATVCVACAIDSEAAVERARKSASGEAKASADRNWKAFAQHAAEEEQTGGARWNPRFWRDDFEKMGTLEEYVEKAQQRADAALREAEQFLAEHGTQSQIVKADAEYARQLIAGPEISAFLKAIGGSATLENQPQGSAILTYIRFHYTSTEA